MTQKGKERGGGGTDQYGILSRLSCVFCSHFLPLRSSNEDNFYTRVSITGVFLVSAKNAFVPVNAITA